MVRFKQIYGLLFLAFAIGPVFGQLKIASSTSKVNFREGPSKRYKILHTIDKSDLLVILPSKKQNGFVEAFDVETSKSGFVFELLIDVIDTLESQKQSFFEESGVQAEGDIEIKLINRTNTSIFIWINNNFYDVLPHEMKVLILQDEDITYFSSSPGIFPIYGKETLKKGNIYNWNFSL